MRHNSAVLRRRVEFALLRTWAGARLRAGAREPTAPTRAPIVSTVVRLPAPLTQPLAPVLGELAARWPEHHHYPLETIHMTVLSLAVLPAPAAAPAWRAAVRALVESVPAFEAEARGLGVSPETMFVQLFPHGPGLGELRRRLASLADPAGPRARQAHRVLRALFFRRLAFANVVRFRGRVAPELLARAAAARQLDLGRFTVREVELVLTDKLFSRAGTTILERFTLAGGDGQTASNSGA